MGKKGSKDFSKIYRPDRCDPLINAVDSGELEMRALKREDYPGTELPEEVLPGILSIGYWDAKTHQNWGLDWHRNEGIEFTFLESGNLSFSTETEQFNLVPGNLTVTRPWQLHKVGNPEVTVGKLHWLIIDVQVRQPHQQWEWPDWIILSKQDLDFLTLILRQNDIQVWNSDRKIQQCFKELGYCLDNCNLEIPQSKFNILINDLLLEILCLFKTGKVKLDESLTLNLRTVEIFLNYLRSDYEKLWTLDDMAEHCGIGKTSLSKYCKQLTNMTPIDYLINLRLHAAAEILRENKSKNITDVGYSCGFSTSQYFATVFKNHYKCTPSEYSAKYIKS
ncbi:AraC family transcriptional regulator [Arenibacter algicola]|uniref:AraC family transcriptional regulator n=1 Tax=Arenibacter algicola TaxID=616991 RepID=UPI0005556825|nr:AraC family transcriptional regulator [Arenibacter algicola]